MTLRGPYLTLFRWTLRRSRRTRSLVSSSCRRTSRNLLRVRRVHQHPQRRSVQNWQMTSLWMLWETAQLTTVQTPDGDMDLKSATMSPAIDDGSLQDSHHRYRCCGLSLSFFVFIFVVIFIFATGYARNLTRRTDHDLDI